MSKQFAVWIRSELNILPELIIAHSIVMEPAAYALASLLEEIENYNISVITIQTPLHEGSTLSTILPYMKKQAIILTDAIVSGNNIRDLLSILTILDVHMIFTVIDGRPGLQDNEPIALNVSSEAIGYPVRAILRDPIIISERPTNPKKDEETLSVVDSTTHIPTRYIRQITPYIDAKQVAEAAVKANALFEGHFAYSRTHYTQAFDLKSLFSYLSEKVISWILEQIAFLKRHIERKTIIIICDTKGEFQWLYNKLLEDNIFETNINIKHITKNEILSHLPPFPINKDDNKETDWVGILPGIASAESALLFLEYASRHHPHSIMILGLLCRTGPQFLNLLSGINYYRDAIFRFSSFARFPDSGYPADTFVCPLCSFRRRLRSIQLPPGLEHLDKLLKSHISALGYEDLPIHSDADRIIPIANELTVNRVYIRALYESAAYDIVAKREINQLLNKDNKYIDAFLCILTREFLTPQFQLEEIQERLIDVFPKVLERVRQLLNITMKHVPYNLIYAIEHLCPGVLAVEGPEIIRRINLKEFNLDDFCIAVIIFDVIPVDLSAWNDVTKSIDNEEQRTLITELIQFLYKRESEIETRTTRCLESFAKLFGDFMRSSRFVEILTELKNFLPAKPEPLDRVAFIKTCNALWSFWQQRILYRIQNIKDTFVCRIIQGKRKIRSRLYELGKIVSDLYLKAKATYTDIDFQEKITHFKQILENMEGLRISIGQNLYEFACNVTKCKIVKINDGMLKTRDGSQLFFKKEIDFDVDLCFFLPEDLDYICSELFSNWLKHKHSNCRGSQVIFRIRDKGDSVAMEFEDDIEGDFDMMSIGGLNACLGCIPNLTTQPEVVSELKENDLPCDSNKDFIAILQLLFWYARRIVIEIGRRGRSGSSTYIAHVQAEAEEGLRECRWYVKVNASPSILHNEVKAHKNMARKGLPHARMVQILWPNVIHLSGLSAIAYQLVDEAEPALLKVSNPTSILNLVDQLATPLSELHINRITQTSIIRTILKPWIGVKSRYDTILAKLKGSSVERLITGLLDGFGPDILDHSIRYDHALIHGDLHTENILIGKDIVFIDFAMATAGAVAYDCAKLYRDLILRTPEILVDGFKGWGYDELSKRLSKVFGISAKQSDKALVEIFAALEFAKGLTSKGYLLNEKHKEILTSFLSKIDLINILKETT